MNIRDHETLRRIEQNDDTMKRLWIGDSTDNLHLTEDDTGIFNSRVGNDYSRLGKSIRENTHLTRLEVELNDDIRGHEITLDVTHTAFFNGIKCNSSICEMILFCHQQSIVGGVPNEILKAYQANNNLTHLLIANANVENEGDHVIATTLRRLAHLKRIGFYDCNISHEQLLPMVETVRGHASLEELYLCGNSIGNVGCSILATLLEDPNSNLCTLDLTTGYEIEIDNDGITILANSLANNAKLRKLFLSLTSVPQCVQDVFSEILCNTSGVNQTYLSNHTLEEMTSQNDMSLTGTHLGSLLQLNMCPNKSHVAIKKILKYHPNIDMAPLFDWDMEGEDEHNLKALPYVIAWFERAQVAVAEEEDGESYNIEGRQLSAIYQFARALPLLFVPASHHVKGGDHKRKRCDD